MVPYIAFLIMHGISSLQTPLREFYLDSRVIHPSRHARHENRTGKCRLPSAKGNFVFASDLHPASMLSFVDAVARFQSVPSSSLWTWKQATTFVNLCRRLSVQTSGGSPGDLPPNAISFLAAVLDQDEETIQQCWAAIWDILPELDTADQDEQDMLFRVHGSDFMVAAETLNPPYVTCQTDECHGKRLIAKHGPVRVRIFTLRRGVLPAFEQGLYCRGLL